MKYNTAHKEEAQALILRMLEKHRPEELAVIMEKSLGTIYLWKTGKRTPSKGDFELLKRINLDKK